MLLDKTDSYKVSHYLQMPEDRKGSKRGVQLVEDGVPYFFDGWMRVNDTLEDIRSRG